MAPLLDDQIRQWQDQVGEAVTHLLHLTQEIGHDQLSHTIQELRSRITEPFMFVIVGEVKAGKSSFINALLETEYDICKVAPSPMTDTIQQIVYGDQPHEEIVSQYLKRIYHPVEILKEIAIVDTPGTNTIIAHHQEITERFIPGSDLIIFVFEAKNPYRQSAWEFFDYIHQDWRKKIIFVLQQKDLMNENDLQINLEGVRKQAKDKGIESPVVFAVSALMEQEGAQETSGYQPLRQYIHQQITGGQAQSLKLSSSLDTAQTVAGKIGEGLSLRKDQWEVDRAFREDIGQTLEKQGKVSYDHVGVLVENLLAGYDSTMRDKSDELSQVLSFGAVLSRSFRSLFSKKESIKEWLTQFTESIETDLNHNLRQKLNDRVLDLAESIQQMGQIIDLKIRSSRTVLKNDHEIFSAIAERRSKVLTELQETFTEFLKNSENFADQELFPEKETMAPSLATGGGIAVVGVILTIVTNGVVFDVTGGVLTTIGLLFAGISLGLQKRKIMKSFSAEIDRGRGQLGQEVTTRLQQYIDQIRQRIDATFADFDQMHASEKQALDKLEGDLQTIVTELSQIQKQLAEQG